MTTRRGDRATGHPRPAAPTGSPSATGSSTATGSTGSARPTGAGGRARTEGGAPPAGDPRGRPYTSGANATITAELPLVRDRLVRSRGPVQGDSYFHERRLPAPVTVRIAVWTLFLLLLLLLAGLAALYEHPDWFSVLRNTEQPLVATPSSTPPPPAPAAKPAAMVLVSSSPTGATYRVPARAFTLAVATAVRSWTEVRSPAGSTAPGSLVFAATIAPQKAPRRIAVRGSASVVFGASPSSIEVRAGGALVGTVKAPRAGRTYVFVSST